MKVIQYGDSLSSDFRKGTWTFKMDEDFAVSAGCFAIIPLKEFSEQFEFNENKLNLLIKEAKKNRDTDVKENYRFWDGKVCAYEQLLELSK